MRVLITGFNPNDDGLNASELVVVSLSDRPTQELSQYIHDINFKIMPQHPSRTSTVRTSGSFASIYPAAIGDRFVSRSIE